MGFGHGRRSGPGVASAHALKDEFPSKVFLIHNRARDQDQDFKYERLDWDVALAKLLILTLLPILSCTGATTAFPSTTMAWKLPSRQRPASGESQHLDFSAIKEKVRPRLADKGIASRRNVLILGT